MNNPSTIAVGPLDEQCTGDQWIARLNTDVVEQILALLDPWSLLQFTLVCKPFYEIFFNDRVLWAHTLQTLAAQECLAPHSFDHPKFRTAAALRRIATQFYRFTDAIVEPNRLLRAHVDEYQLGQLTVGVNKVAVDHDDGVLLPGGRWLLSVVTESEEGPDGWPRYLSCWDLLGAVDGTLVSAASIPLEGGIWGEAGTAGMRTHMCEGGKAVAIAFLFVGSVEDNGDDTLVKVFLLTWDEDIRPQLSEAAALRYSDVPFLVNSTPLEMRLAGDFISINDLCDLAIWNWTNDEIAIIDPQGHDWTMGRGFDVQLAGTQPLVCIVPSNEKELLISQLPPLALRGSAVALDRKPLLPVQAISMHPEMLPNTDIHAIRLFEGWKPPSMQPGLAVIYCFKHKHFMSLQSENSELTVQLSVIDTSLDAITKYPRLGRHPRLGDWVYELEDVKDGMDHVQLKGHSLHGEEIQCRVNRALPLSSIWPRGGHPSPLCLYSGAALAYIADMSIDDPTKSVWVMRIDGF